MTFVHHLSIKRHLSCFLWINFTTSRYQSEETAPKCRVQFIDLWLFLHNIHPRSLSVAQCKDNAAIDIPSTSPSFLALFPCPTSLFILFRFNHASLTPLCRPSSLIPYLQASGWLSPVIFRPKNRNKFLRRKYFHHRSIDLRIIFQLPHSQRSWPGSERDSMRAKRKR